MAIHSHILHNGEIHNASDTLLRAGQVGLLSGWGVFSTLRVKDGALFAFERHWARMLRDAHLLSVTMPSDEHEIEQSLLRLVGANGRQNCTLRMVVVRNGGSMFAGPLVAGRESDVIAFTADSKDWGTSVRLTVQPNGRFAAGEFAAAKILSWGANLVWAERAQKQGFDETILLNEHGRVAECTSANIFAVFGNDVYTPPVSDGCLPGITREVLLHEVHVPGVRILEHELTIRDLETADEVCITSTTRDLLPVREIAGQPLGTSGEAGERVGTSGEAGERVGKSSEVRERVTAAFREFMKEDIARRKRTNAPALV
jgi:branched-chain amino acid aminotransferase